MGKQHCICQEDPCKCFSGWGYFEREDDLLSEIEAEIGAEERRQGVRQRQADVEAVQWMVSECGASDEEIAETLGISTPKVRRIVRQLSCSRDGYKESYGEEG